MRIDYLDLQRKSKQNGTTRKWQSISTSRDYKLHTGFLTTTQITDRLLSVVSQ